MVISNRDIRFKAWDIKTQTMHRVFRLCILCRKIIYEGEDPHIYVRQLSECVLLQYIGLQDKRGNLIYEGDTLSYQNKLYTVLYKEAGFYLVSGAEELTPTNQLCSQMEIVSQFPS